MKDERCLKHNFSSITSWVLYFLSKFCGVINYQLIMIMFTSCVSVSGVWIFSCFCVDMLSTARLNDKIILCLGEQQGIIKSSSQKREKIWFLETNFRSIDAAEDRIQSWVSTAKSRIKRMNHRRHSPSNTFHNLHL